MMTKRGWPTALVVFLPPPSYLPLLSIAEIVVYYTRNHHAGSLILARAALVRHRHYAVIGWEL